ncbi:hypothetical protein ASD90_01430 [Terrabacter sp. Root181]|nr:hypothetical protein ASD90_01430 [Terrabacter sp. Root181]
MRIRPLGRILRDFELALTGRHHQHAVEALAEIERNRQLTASNLLFLRFRLVATFETTQNATNFPDLATLIAIRRPRAVTVALQRLMFDAYLVVDNQALPVDQAIERFKIEVSQRYGALFTVLSPTDDPSAARLQMLAASTAEIPNEGYAEDVLSRPWSLEVSAWLQAVWARRRQEPQPQRTALQVYQLGDLDAAFTAALTDAPGLVRTKIVVITAVSIGTQDAAIAAVEAFDTLPEDEQADLLNDALVRLALHELRGRTRFLPGNWTEWFQRLEGDPNRETIELLDEALAGWQATVLDSDQAVRALSDLFLATRGPAQMTLVADAVPRALAYSQRSGASGARLAPLHNALLAVLTYESDLTATDLGAISDLASTVLNTGMETAQYKQLLLDLLDVWTRVKSWRRCDWAADILDAALASPAPDPVSRDAFVIELYSQLTAYADRVSEAQRVLLRLLGREASQPIEVWHAKFDDNAEDPPSEAPTLDGLAIGIYTLDEGAAAKARSWILEIAPSAKVVLNHEHDASERLTAMVRGSDIVVIGWATAKHAATNHIRDIRRGGTIVAMAEGRGATGLLRAVMSAVI